MHHFVSPIFFENIQLVCGNAIKFQIIQLASLLALGIIIFFPTFFEFFLYKLNEFIPPRFFDGFIFNLNPQVNYKYAHNCFNRPHEVENSGSVQIGCQAISGSLDFISG